MKQRDISYDIIRILSTIWIVFVWHFSNYYWGSPFQVYLLESWGGLFMTETVLASFTLISGLFLGMKQVSTANDVWKFYKNRFCRFYILYLIAGITLYYTPCSWGEFYSSTTQLILSSLGLSCFYGGMPSTLWYMCMLLFFYLITPTFLKVNHLKRVALGGMLWTILYLLRKTGVQIDNRILLYFPFYVLGVSLNPEKYKVVIMKYTKYLVPICIFTIVILRVSHNIIFHIPCVLAGVSLFSLVCVYIEQALPKRDGILSLIAFSSSITLAAYFFHRQVYALFEVIGVPVYWGIIAVIVVSYLIDKIYSKLILYIH